MLLVNVPNSKGRLMPVFHQNFHECKQGSEVCREDPDTGTLTLLTSGKKTAVRFCPFCGHKGVDIRVLERRRKDLETRESRLGLEYGDGCIQQ
jgi:hypothetical protein